VQDGQGGKVETHEDEIIGCPVTNFHHSVRHPLGATPLGATLLGDGGSLER
jgi:hypothetical protein